MSEDTTLTVSGLLLQVQKLYTQTEKGYEDKITELNAEIITLRDANNRYFVSGKKLKDKNEQLQKALNQSIAPTKVTCQNCEHLQQLITVYEQTLEETRRHTKCLEARLKDHGIGMEPESEIMTADASAAKDLNSTGHFHLSKRSKRTRYYEAEVSRRKRRKTCQEDTSLQLSEIPHSTSTPVQSSTPRDVSSTSNRNESPASPIFGHSQTNPQTPTLFDEDIGSPYFIGNKKEKHNNEVMNSRNVHLPCSESNDNLDGCSLNIASDDVAKRTDKVKLESKGLKLSLSGGIRKKRSPESVLKLCVTTTEQNAVDCSEQRMKKQISAIKHNESAIKSPSILSGGQQPKSNFNVTVPRTNDSIHYQQISNEKQTESSCIVSPVKSGDSLRRSKRNVKHASLEISQDSSYAESRGLIQTTLSRVFTKTNTFALREFCNNRDNCLDDDNVTVLSKDNFVEKCKLMTVPKIRIPAETIANENIPHETFKKPVTPKKNVSKHVKLAVDSQQHVKPAVDSQQLSDLDETCLPGVLHSASSPYKVDSDRAFEDTRYGATVEPIHACNGSIAPDFHFSQYDLSTVQNHTQMLDHGKPCDKESQRIMSTCASVTFGTRNVQGSDKSDSVIPEEENDGKKMEDSFDVPCKKKEFAQFAYVDVIRKQDERRKLPAYFCQQCYEYYKGQDLTDDEVGDKMKDTCRHRASFAPPSTPENFWKLGFPEESGDNEVSTKSNDDQCIKRRRKPYKQRF